MSDNEVLTEQTQSEVKPKIGKFNKKSLLNRTFVGAAIFAVMVGMILLNVFVPDNNYERSFSFISGRAVNALIISVLILLAVIEMRRALGEQRIPGCFSWLLWAYGFCIGPAYSLFGYMGILFVTLLVVICAVVTSLVVNRVDSLMFVAFMLVYPGLFLATLLYLNRSASTQVITESSPFFKYLANDIWYYIDGSKRVSSQLLPLDAISLAFVFAVSSFTDIFAYFCGSLFGKRKLCPDISPKKTVEGAIGGLIGGVFGSAVVYVVFEILFPLCGKDYFGLTMYLSTFNKFLTYGLIGVFGSVMNQIGDLVASQVKRFCGIKDYSRVLGEHGGIMDRFDGIMFNSVWVAFVFMFIV